MDVWKFRTTLSGVPDDLEEWSEALLARGCNDGTMSLSKGVPKIDWHRTAETLSSAIRSATDDVEFCGYKVERIEIPTEAVAAWSA